MVNFGPLAAEIVSLVWGTTCNFNGFRVLAALLHGTLVVGVSQTASLNRGRNLYSVGRPSRWALAHISSFEMPSVLWHRWLDVRKSIWPVKIEWWGAGVIMCLQQSANDCIWSSWCHCHPIISCFIKIQIGLIFSVLAYQVVLEKRPLNRCLLCYFNMELFYSCTTRHNITHNA